ncbi:MULTISPECIES: hypothetical protein [Bacillus]|jgi:spore germination protein PD|uniref:Spore germination protein PD n=1 Tax=Bacillus smithii 7_3_47FAA TaxID=665952 RepID=G9QK83_9BACI|nr:hypothetical protein [Bacillus smithii]AKP46344.1 Protein GerPDrequired for proper assembly of spore coatmutations lead to super-dormant spore [Bacillus smithii]EHL78445.1 hypothetical protein HMPREF1015_01622 [Bacillus smithii 7_3_47FAA]MED0660757.1 spore gernimation protein GerPD [Bacillus smithii]MED1420612.1 spore gernimation protein GerPD [Bacillus smithii]MED1454979.1 spore gernimation protein GerPD [Bacillus smithii]
MNLQVSNHELKVANIKITGVSSSSLVLIGDANQIQLFSAFDTPPEALIVGPFVPFSPRG